MTLPAQDIVDRLRDYGLTLEESVVICDRRVVDQAANLISRLTTDNEALRKERDEARARGDSCIYAQMAAEARADAFAQGVEKLRQERDELQAVFDLRWEADMRAISKWRDAGPGRELTLPDHVDLVIFLFEWVEELLGALEPFAKFAEKAERFVQGRADFGGSPIMPTKHFRLADFRRARAALGDRP